MLEFSSGRHLVGLLQTLQQSGKLQADGGEAGSWTGILEIAMRMVKDGMQRRQCVHAGAAAGDGLHDERLERLEVDDANLVVKKPHSGLHGSRDKVIDGQLRVVAPNLSLARAFRRRNVKAFMKW